MNFVEELFAATGYTTENQTVDTTTQILLKAAKNYIISNLEEVQDRLKDRLKKHRCDMPELNLARCIVTTAHVKSVRDIELQAFYDLALLNTNKRPATHTQKYSEDLFKFYSGRPEADFRRYIDVAFHADSSIRPPKEQMKHVLKEISTIKVPITKELADQFLIQIIDVDITEEANYNVFFKMLDYLNKYTPKAGIIYERKFNEFWANANKRNGVNMWGVQSTRFSSKSSERTSIMKSIFTCTDEELRYKIAKNFLLKQDPVLKKRLLKMVPEFGKLLNLA